MYPTKVGGTNRAANNIFVNHDNKLSGARSPHGSSEAELRAMNRKETRLDLDTSKDEVTYVFEKGMENQADNWNDDEIERTFGSFARD